MAEFRELKDIDPSEISSTSPFNTERWKELSGRFRHEVGDLINDLRFHFDELTEEEKLEHLSRLRGSEVLVREAFSENLELSVLASIEELAEVHDYEEEIENLETGQNKFALLGFKMLGDLAPNISVAMREGRLDAWRGLRAYGKLLQGGARDRQRGIDALAKDVDLIGVGLDVWGSTYI